MNKIAFQSIINKYDDIPVFVDNSESLNRQDFIIIEYQSLDFYYSDDKIHGASQQTQVSYYHIDKNKSDKFIKFIIKNFKNVIDINISYDENLDLNVVFVRFDILFNEFMNG